MRAEVLKTPKVSVTTDPDVPARERKTLEDNCSVVTTVKKRSVVFVQPGGGGGGGVIITNISK